MDNMKKVVITGATGLIGGHLVLQLLRAGEYEITAVGSSGESFVKLDGLLRGYGVEGKYVRAVADLGDIDDCRKILTPDTDIIFHCAARVSLGKLKKGEGEMLVWDNVEMTHNMTVSALKLFQSGNKRPLFVHVSSIAAFGGSLNSRGMVDEQSIMGNLLAASPYSRSKFLSENEVWRAKAHGLPVVVVNPGVVLGAMIPEAEFWLQKLAKVVSRGLSVWIDGETSFVGAGDVARAMIILSEHPESWGERYLLSAGNHTYRELLTELRRMTGRKHPEPGWKIPGGVLKFMGLFYPACKSVAENGRNPKTYDGSKITRSVPFEYQDWSGMWLEIGAFGEKI